MAVRKTFFLFLGMLLLTSIIYRFSNVDISVTEEDVKIIKTLDLESTCDGVNSFSDELTCIFTTQKMVYTSIDVGKGIEEDESREPSDLLKMGKGLCYDRSRFIEKILTYYGFEIRHVSIFYERDTFLPSFLDRGSKSHAFLEVKTHRGWLLVDSIDVFMGIDKERKLYTAKQLRTIQVKDTFQDINGNKLPQNFFNDYSIVYGLYSRHGRFYPPYNRIPDINWKQFLQYNW